MTTIEAARLAHCSLKNIQAAIHRGKLPARKVGRDWQIQTADFEKWFASPRKVGRPAREELR